ncbi:MAG: ABC transporter ATP-binding protein [Firmicutes bacterium HGW-Firmicutes-8]|nr:MAG: ABC transporter ATP-binding protein [Firmicutes bacterium HGW-Firmicutes-8]
MDKDIAIKAENVSKVYKLYDKPLDRLKESINPFGKKYHKEFYALNDVSFEVKKGETVGIIGKNGSGKSTLLEIITGVLTPTSGTINVKGKVSALLELGAGFNPELTGIENIYLNGTIMGYSKDEIDKRLKNILSFADIGEFVYQPVKMYSSGMFVRLAFAVAVNVEPNILIVDEALAVGDGKFQLKCFERIKSLQEAGTTILIVSHDLQSIRQFCDFAFLIDKGVLLEIGAPNIIVNHYIRILFSSEDIELPEVPNKKNENKVGSTEGNELKEYRYGTQDGIIEYFEVLNNDLKPARAVTTCDEVVMRMIVTAKKPIEKPIYAMTIKTIKGLEVYGTNSYFQAIPFNALKLGDSIEVTFRQRLALMPGNYYISFGFVELNSDNIVPLDRRYDAVEVKVLPEGHDRSFGLANLTSEININYFNKKELGVWDSTKEVYK